MALHGNLTQSDGLHSPFAWVWADSAERTAEVVTTDDLNKIGLQEDTGIVYRLETLTPTWTPFAGATAIADLTDVDITAVADGDILVYNSVSAEWENQPASTLSEHSVTTPLTNAVTDVVNIVHESTGTPAADFGTGLALLAENNASTNVKIGGAFAAWATINTHSIFGLTGYASGATRLLTVRAPNTAATNPTGLGEGAIDFQTYRTVATITARGTQSAIFGGQNNLIGLYGQYSAIVGGAGNQVDSEGSFATGYGNYLQLGANYSFVAGSNNTIDGGADRGTITGGNSNRIYSNLYGFVGNGYENTIGAPNPYNAIINGKNNQIQGITYGSYGFVGTGVGNLIGDSVHATILGGNTNQIGSGGTGANYGIILGGTQHLITGDYGVVLGGAFALADKHNQIVSSGGRFAARGDSQGTVQMVLRRSVTHSTTNPYELYLDGASARMTIPTNTIWTFHVLVVGTNSGNTKRFGYAIQGVVSNNGVTTAILASTVTTVYEDDVNFSAAANTAPGIFIVEVADSGAAGDTIRWTATVRTAEVTFA